MYQPAKVAIIGTGFVGSTTAFSLLLSGAVSQILLYDREKKKAEGRVMDLLHGNQFTPKVELIPCDDFKALKDSDIILLTLGAHQEKGETRLDLIKKNAILFKELMPKITKYNKKAIYIVVTNPVDVCTYLALKYGKLKKEQVFGTGTTLDTARLKWMLGEHFKVNTKNVHSYVLGEHGDSSFTVLSSASIGCIPLKAMKGYSKQVIENCIKKTRNAAYEVIARQGATYYAISLVVTELIKAIVEDRKELLPLSVYLNNYKGISDVCLSVPVVLGRKGIEQVMDIPLSKEEVSALENSAKIVKDCLKEYR